MIRLFLENSMLEKFEKHLATRLNRIMDWAPSDSSVSYSVTKLKDGYKSIVKIVSSQGRFVAEAVGHDVSDVVKSVSMQMQTQIAEWRSKRFQV